MRVSDEMLSAFLDGELSETERDVVEAELKASEDLRQRLMIIRKADEKATEYFSEIDSAPLSENLTVLLETLGQDQAPDTQGFDDNVISLDGRKPQEKQPSRWALPLAASIALMIGFGTGQMTVPVGDDATVVALIDQTNGLVRVTNPLHKVLEEGASGAVMRLAGSEIVTATPVLSFRTVSGDYCREVLVTGETAASRNLACKQTGGTWQILVMTSATAVSDVDYLPASGEASGAIDSQIDALIDGPPLGQVEEAELIINKWHSDH